MGFLKPVPLTVAAARAADPTQAVKSEQRALGWTKLLKSALGPVLFAYVLLTAWLILQIAVVFGFLGYAAFIFSRTGGPAVGWNQWLQMAALLAGGAIAAALLLVFLGAGLFSLFDRVRQLIADRMARIAFINTVHGKPEVFTLYLRAFDTTEQVRTAHRRSLIWRMLQVAKFVLYSIFIGPFTGSQGRERAFARMFFDRRSHTEMEHAIWADFRLGTPLLALGNTDGKFGAGKIATTDADWKETAALLIDKSRSIICLPDDNAGTLWELGYLQETSAVGKTAFIMPSLRALPHRKLTFEKEWAHMAGLAAGHGLTIPSYRAEGMFFAVVVNDKPPFQSNFDFTREGRFRLLFDEINAHQRTREEQDELDYDRRRRRRRR